MAEEQMIGGTSTTTSPAQQIRQFESLTNAGIGQLPTTVPAGLSVQEYDNPVHRTEIPLSALRISTTDVTTNGAYGSQELYTFPAGNIVILGTSTRLVFTRVGTNIAATAAILHSLGTSAEATDGTLNSLQANIQASSSQALVAGVSPTTGSQSSAVVVPGFSGTPRKVFLNIGLADGDSAGNDALDVTGTVVIIWTNAKGKLT